MKRLLTKENGKPGVVMARAPCNGKTALFITVSGRTTCEFAVK